MAIGTTVRVGFDGNDVKKGFGGISKMFTGAAKSFGKGAMMMTGAMGAKSLLGLGLEAATGMKDLADFAGAAEDVATQTGATTSEILKLNRALQLAGSELDAGRMLNTLSDNIFDATHGGEELQKAFEKIGIAASDLETMKPMDQFMAVGKALAEYKGSIGEIVDIQEKLFGGKMGMKLLMLFKNADVFAGMGSDISDFANNVENSKAELGDFSDQLQRLPYMWKSLNLAAFKALGANGGVMKKLFDGMDTAINTGDFAKLGYALKAEFAKALEVFNDSGIMDGIKAKFKSIGNSIGEGISESLKIPSLIKKIFVDGKDNSTAMINEMQRTNMYLASIEKTNGTYA